MAGLYAELDRINALADAEPGFVWGLQGDGNDATDLRPAPDPLFLINMSVWRDADALFAFVYKTAHVGVMARRRDWLERFSGAYQALWWVRSTTSRRSTKRWPNCGSSTATARSRKHLLLRFVSRRQACPETRSICNPINGALAAPEITLSDSRTNHLEPIVCAIVNVDEAKTYFSKLLERSSPSSPAIRRSPISVVASWGEADLRRIYAVRRQLLPARYPNDYRPRCCPSLFLY